MLNVWYITSCLSYAQLFHSEAKQSRIKACDSAPLSYNAPWPWEMSLGQLIVSVHLHSAISSHNPTESISFILSLLPLFSALSYSSPDSHLPLPIASVISLDSLFYFSALIFWRWVQRILAILASGLRRLRDPVGAYHTSWAAGGEKKEWWEKAIWSISNCILLPQRTPPVSVSFHCSSLSPRPSSPLEKLYF